MTNKEAFEQLDPKVGDKVVMTKICVDFEGGWSNCWGGHEMDSALGKTHTITTVRNDEIQIGDRWNYPALAFMNQPNPKRRKEILAKIRRSNKNEILLK
tara:strand:+ start:7632 stop:7928 length:297 start_codon:yes stop_codon:yes gene_type:complete